MIKYRTTAFCDIEPLEVVRETEKQVVIASRNGGREHRENKTSDWNNWHDTWDAAHAFLVAKAERDVELLRNQLSRANGKLGQIKGMKPSNGRLE